jgi:DNA-binding MarR family transcriptional regulator
VIARVARLLDITDLEARAVLHLAAGGSEDLAAALDLSEGGARALARRLQELALVRSEPVPHRPRELRLRLSAAAERELAAALAVSRTARSP